MASEDTVRLEQCPSTPLAVIRRQARQSELSQIVPQCCGQVWEVLRAQGIQGGRNIAVYLDGSIQLEAGVECAADFSERDGVVRSALPAGTAVSVTHYGPYASLGSAHEAALAWCEANDRRLAGPSWEIYGHWQPEWDSDPSQIRTDVFYQLDDSR